MFFMLVDLWLAIILCFMQKDLQVIFLNLYTSFFTMNSIRYAVNEVNI